MPEEDRWQLNKGWIEFILLEAPADKLATMTGAIFDLAIDHEAEVDMMGSLVVMSYGTAGGDTGQRRKRFPLMDAVKKKFKQEIKLVHGAGFGHYGFVGGRGGGRFTFMLPQFDRAKTELTTLDWGEIRELPPA